MPTSTQAPTCDLSCPRRRASSKRLSVNILFEISAVTGSSAFADDDD